MAIYNYLDASTCHITKEDAIALGKNNTFNGGFRIGKYPEGFIISVFSEFDDEHKNTKYSNAFYRLLKYARDNECPIIRIDADGDIINILEKFDW